MVVAAWHSALNGRVTKKATFYTLAWALHSESTFVDVQVRGSTQATAEAGPQEGSDEDLLLMETMGRRGHQHRTTGP